MKTNSKFTILFAALYCCIACGPSQDEYNKLVEENSNLKKEIEGLKKEVENFNTTPSILYAEAERQIKTNNIQGLRNTVNKLHQYHPSSTEYKKAKDILDKLTAAENKKKKAEEEKIIQQKKADEAKRLQAVNKLRKEIDDINGITWYQNPYFVHYNNSNHISVYIGKRSDSKPWLRLKMSYYGNGWIFFDSAYLSYDGNTKEIYFNEYNDKKSENDSSCWEWIDVGVDDITLQFLQNMIEGKSVKMRLSGKYTKDKVLTSSEINGIKDVLLAYDVLMKE